MFGSPSRPRRTRSGSLECRSGAAAQYDRRRSRNRYANRYLERAAAGELRWVLSAYPTEAAAQDASMVAYRVRGTSSSAQRSSTIPIRSRAVAGVRQAAHSLGRGFSRTKRGVSNRHGGHRPEAVTEGRTRIASKGRRTSPTERSSRGLSSPASTVKIRFTYPGVFNATRRSTTSRLRVREAAKWSRRRPTRG